MSVTYSHLASTDVFQVPFIIVRFHLCWYHKIVPFGSLYSPVWKPPPMVLVHRQPRVLPHRSFLQDDEAPSPSWNYHWPPTPTIKVTSKVRSIHLPITSLSPHNYLTKILLSPHYNLTITSLSDSPHLAPLWPPLLFGSPPLPPWTTISIKLRLARKDWNCLEFLQHQHLKVWAHPVMHFFAWHSLHSPSSPSHPCSTGLASLPMVDLKLNEFICLYMV